MHNFWAENIGECGEEVTLDKRENEHAFKILRLRTGEKVALLDGHGVKAAAEVTAGNTMLIKSVERRIEPDLKFSLWCAAPKRPKLEILLKQASELGAWQVRLIKCRYSVACPDNIERLNALLIEGCKQSGNPWKPKLAELTAFNDLPEKLQEDGNGNKKLYFGDVKNADETNDRGGFPVLPERGEVIWLVGPEGGFADEEINMLRSWGALGINLGPNILRLETAAAAGMAVLQCLSRIK